MTHSFLSVLSKSKSNIEYNTLDPEITAMLSIDLYDMTSQHLDHCIKLFKEPRKVILEQDLATVVATEDTVFKDSKGEVVEYKDFFKTQDFIFDSNGNCLGSRFKRRVSYTEESYFTILLNVLKVLVEYKIAYNSEWQDSYIYIDKLQEYLKEEYDTEEVLDYLLVVFDKVFLEITDIYKNYNWSVFEVKAIKSKLYISRYGDWRAYQWHIEQHDKEQERLAKENEDKTGQLR